MDMEQTSGSTTPFASADAERLDGAAFGDVLRHLRLRAGLTQEELAERAGLSARGISDLERGVRRSPHAATVDALADALELSADERESFHRLARRRLSHGSPAPDNLPTPLTSFVGREQEMACLRHDLLDDDIRLVTLTGVAGAGKSRLALEVAGRVRDWFGDGVCHVNLSAVASPTEVPSAIVRALSDRDGTPYLSTDNLAGQLRSKRMLLVLDNAEHLTAAAPEIADLLRSCPGLKVLVTSRVPLRLAVERIHEVPPLSLPDPAAGTCGTAPCDAARSEAVRLFRERASALGGGVDVAAGNEDVVAGICSRLDGLPLAIELAAARIRVLSPQEILARLERPLDVLGSGTRETPPRQRTLRSTLEWSEALLGERERRLFARLAVFSDGWDLEAVESVCTDDADTAADVMERLSTLVDSSLLTSRVDERSGRMRFGMLATVRAFALDRLREDAQEEHRTRRRHALHYLQLAEQAASGILGEDEGRWYRQLEIEHANIRTALEWARESGETAIGLRLAVATWRSWEARAQLEGGLAWLRTFLAADPEDAAPVLRAGACYAAGMLACALGRYDEAERYLEACLDHHRTDENEAGIGVASNGLGVVAMREGHYDRAEELFRSSIDIARSLGDEQALAIRLGNLGIAALYRGHLEEARRIFSENLTRCRGLGLAQEVAESLNFLGFAALYRHNHAEAIGIFAESLEAARESGDHVCAIESERGLGCALLLGGHLDEAEQHLARALSSANDAGDLRRVARALDAHGCLAWERDDRARAIGLWRAAESARTQAGVVEHPAERKFLDRWRSRMYEPDVGELRPSTPPLTVDEAVVLARSTDG